MKLFLALPLLDSVVGHIRVQQESIIMKVARLVEYVEEEILYCLKIVVKLELNSIL